MVFNETSLNSNWNLKTLEELGLFKRGKSKHRPRNDIKLFENGTIPLVQTGDIKAANIYLYKANEFYNEFGLKQSKLWNEGTLCITIAANIAETAILKEKMCFPDSVVGFIAFDNETTSHYIHYLFSFIRFRIQNSIQGSIQDNINIDYLTKLKFRIPEFSAQQKIASVLSALDDKIELNNRINVELEAMAKTLYDYWFVQFDFPVSDALASTPLSQQSEAGRERNNVVERKGFMVAERSRGYKSSGGKMVYNETLKREIPEGWEVKNLFEVCNVQYGFPFSTEYFNEIGNGIPVIRIRDIIENSVSNYSTEKNIDSKYEILKGDLLIGMDGNFHINYWTKNNCYLNQRVVKLTEKELPNIYLRYQIEPYIKAREASVSRTTVGHLSDKDLKAINILVPPKEIKLKIKNIYSNALNKIITNKEQNQELSTLRDWLLPMLMNGQVKVE